MARNSIRGGVALAILVAMAGAGATAEAQEQGDGEGRDGGAARHTGHSTVTPSLRALARGPAPIQLDGVLSEAVWAQAPVGTGFRQQEPHDGEPATQRTEIRILFDDEALYVGARMFDTEGAAGVRGQLVRRDQHAASDWIQLVFDTYHDHIGRTVFAVNPSGVKQDAGAAAPYADSSWDPVWDVATSIDSLGWSAEFRIPFSQLRFNRGEQNTWGLQVWRTVNRLNEMSMWSYWGRSEPGGAQLFGHVEGLQPGPSQRRAEVLPYLVARMRLLRPGADGDPFYEQHDNTVRGGADFKYRLTSNLTLDATINPDFGQVEVDPAVVNLSAFETFFSERRPFFIEGNGIFSFGGLNCYFCSNVSSMSLFYSRRIGRRPQGIVPSGTEYSDVPDGTTILGAAKLTGRTRSGWSLGLLDAVTGREKSPVLVNGVLGEQEVEPVTNYLVGRAKRDLKGGNLTLGGIATSVRRDLSEPLLRTRVPSSAEAAGVDWSYTWANRNYRFMGNLAASTVSGDPAAIDRLQRSSARYFQRPDREHGGNGLFSDAYDPEASVLRGYGGYARVAKEGGEWLWETAVNFRSPGFEVNDLAFLTRADYFYMNANVARQLNTPTSWYRSMFMILGGQQQFNFDGDRTDAQAQVFANVQFLNYWGIGGFHIRRPEVDDDRALRGGPVVRRPASHFSALWVESDSRKPVSLYTQINVGGDSESPDDVSIFSSLRLRPASNIQVTLSPSWSISRSSQQYVRAVTDPTATDFYGTRYVMADLEQKNLGFDTRLNLTFSPTLTLELFAQPLISSVNYSRFKEFDTPRNLRKSVYGEDRGSISEVRNSADQVTEYRIDPDGPGAAAEFTLANPDFNFRSLRGNAVLRWEYRPGSTLFLVWSQDRSSFDPYNDRLSLGHDLDQMSAAKPDNIFLVKFSYWLNW